jgi:hypothetical protein
VDVCARERAAARPSTPAAIQALELPSCDLLLILQQALASQSTKSKKRRHGLRQQKPATATIPVRVEFTSSTPAVHPRLSTCIQPAPAVARARLHSRCLCGSRLVLTVLTAVASLRFVAASGNKHSSSRAGIAPASRQPRAQSSTHPIPVVPPPTPLPFRNTISSTAVF